jgi:hypothetical protein
VDFRLQTELSEDQPSPGSFGSASRGLKIADRTSPRTARPGPFSILFIRFILSGFASGTLFGKWIRVFSAFASYGATGVCFVFKILRFLCCLL